MMRGVALWLLICLPVFGHELAIDVELEQPKVLLRASYGPGEPAAHVAVVASSANAPARLGISGETDENGTFAFKPAAEGEWLVRVDDGYGHVTTRTVVVNWAGSAAELPAQSSVWARAGAGLFVILGVTTLVFLGRRRAPTQQS